MQKIKIMCVLGTRPEAVKMAPVIQELQSREWAAVHVLATAQHRQMLDQVLAFFGICPDSDLNVMRPNQSLTELTARLLLGAGEVLDEVQPDVVLVQGDTTTVMAVALAAFYRRIPVGHVEAGLRTGDLQNPFPEEANRVIAGRLSRWHFAPTSGARDNLLQEGAPAASVHVTGNTVIDALIKATSSEIDSGLGLPNDKRILLVTCHRRENFGAPFARICNAIEQLARENPDVHVVFPVHPNPNVKTVAEDLLSNIPNIQLCTPLDYVQFVSVMKQSYFIISDSGGVQEEAPGLGKPVLVLREETERPEAVKEGVVELVGTQQQRIVDSASALLNDPSVYGNMARGVSPYGDGLASQRIADILYSDML